MLITVVAFFDNKMAARSFRWLENHGFTADMRDPKEGEEPTIELRCGSRVVRVDVGDVSVLDAVLQSVGAMEIDARRRGLPFVTEVKKKRGRRSEWDLV